MRSSLPLARRDHRTSLSCSRASTWLVASILLLALPASSALAADVAFFPPETTNLSPADNVAVGELLAQAYAGASRQAVLSPARTEDAVAKSTSYEAAAQSLGVREYVRMSTLAAGRLIVVTATRYRADGSFVYQSKMTARSIEDMPAISDRMAKALYYQVDDEAVRTRHNVVLDEARVKPRRASEKVVGFKAGLYMPFARHADYKPQMGLQFDLRFEMERFFLEFGAGLIVPTAVQDDCVEDNTGHCHHGNIGRMAALTSEFGGSFFLTQGNVAPYIGLGMLPRILLNSHDDLATISAYAQVGVMGPRDASTRFYADLRAAQAMIQTHLDNGVGVYTTELTVHLGLGW
jgi:hypothetical protein